MNVVVVQAYVPATAHSDEEIDIVCEEQSKIIKGIKGTEYLVIMGDWNAVIGENRNEKCVGKYRLGQRNQRGKQLIEFCNQQQLVVTNTLFKNYKRRIYTWKAPGDSGIVIIIIIIMTVGFVTCT